MSTTELTTYKGLMSDITNTPTFEGKELTSKQQVIFKKACDAEMMVKSMFEHHGLKFDAKYVVTKNSNQNDYTDYDKMMEKAVSDDSVLVEYPVGGCVGDVVRFTCDMSLERKETLASKLDDVKPVALEFVGDLMRIAFHKKNKQPRSIFNLTGFNLVFRLKAKHKEYPTEYEWFISNYSTNNGNLKALEQNLRYFFDDIINRKSGEEYELRSLA